jgi:hypothetical protein
VAHDAGEIMTVIRRRTNDSVYGMRAALQGLAAIDGPKSVIVVSEGLIFDGPDSQTDELATIAADSRASLDVLLLDVPRFDVTQASMPRTPREDRELQTAGLEQLAGASRGQLYRINTTAEFAFDKISHALDGYYLLGVEARADDRNGKRHRLGIKTSRKGVSIRSRRSFVTSMSAKATSPADAVTRALKSPLPINDLPLKIATWTYKEPGGGKIRVLVAAEVERLVDQPLEYTVGMAVVNKQGRGVAPPVTTTTLKPKAGNEGTAVYSGMMQVDPGEYRVILSMADSEGRVGSVSRMVTAYQLDGPGVSLGDLIIGGSDGTNNVRLEPSLEPAVSGPLAALMEAYSSAGLDGIDATLDILADENSAPLASSPMRVAPGPSPEIANASVQFDTTALPPGRYLARGTIRQGGKTQGHLLRPFRIVASNAAAASPVTMITADMAMVFLGGLSNFDRKELLTPAMLTSMFAIAEGRATGSKAAVKEARSGDLGAAAMTALTDNDQALATFLTGLELYQAAQLDKAAMQFQNSMQMSPTFAPSRLYLGAALAEGNRHKEAAGLIQRAAAANPAIARIAGEEWLKAAQPALAIPPLEQAVLQPNADPRSKKALGLAYVLSGRSADAVPVLTSYLDTNPTDGAALLAALFGTYNRHLAAAQTATLAADRANMAKWSKAYSATKGQMQPLVATWVQYVQNAK